MRTIALEEHFATPAFLDGPARGLKERAEQVGGRFATLVANLLDIGAGRVAAMDAAGVTMQALSLTATGVEQLGVEEAKSFARSTNAALADAIRCHPTRCFRSASTASCFRPTIPISRWLRAAPFSTGRRSATATG
jgi:predicted TIM-barrel fold metal-dependent hydrolase